MTTNEQASRRADKNLFVSKSKLGFTMVELLVILAIGIILIAAVIPVILNYLPGIQLNGYSRTLITNFREGQEKAVSEQDQYIIRLFPETPAKFQQIKSKDGVEQIIVEEQFSERISLAVSETVGNCPTLPEIPSCRQITFSPDGGPSTSGTITLSLSESQSRIITVSPAGFISIQ